MRQFKSLLCLMVMSIVLSFFLREAVFAKASANAPRYYNELTGYEAVIEDDANLLRNMEKTELLEIMKGITEFGDVYFKAIDYNEYYDTPDFAKHYLNDEKGEYGGGSGTVFVIDMACRNIYIFSNGYIYKLVPGSKAESITDNVYQYASEEDYFGCARETFVQMDTLLHGGKIAEPMKYTSNFMLAVLLALLINFGLAVVTSRTGFVSKAKIVNRGIDEVEISDIKEKFVKVTKKYSPSSSSGGSSGGGGGGGGGGHSF